MFNKTNTGLKEKRPIDKSKVISSLIAAFTVPFVLVICASLSVYFSNYAELNFQLRNFLPVLTLVSIVIFIVLFLILLFTKKALRNILFSLCTFVVTAGFIQTLVTTLTFQGLPGDGTAAPASKTKVIINLSIWLLACIGFIFLGVIWNKRTYAHKAMSFLLVLVLVMQSVGILPSAIAYFRDTESRTNKGYLSTEYITELSSKDNIIIIVLDRFDRTFFLDLAKTHPEVLTNLDGFTYYDDNIATYPRTYPAVTSMLTGINNDFSQSRTEYFDYAYTNSNFLKDLKNNNYKINLYTNFFYSYDNAYLLKDTASNVCNNGTYEIIATLPFFSSIVKLSTYFWAPEAFKSQTISASTFGQYVSLGGEFPCYTVSSQTDSKVYSLLKDERFTLQSDENTFTFLHLRGCHHPYSMDENCNVVPNDSVTVLQQTQGCFKIISEYLNQMKELNIYEDSTIIITGDHTALDSDYEEYASNKLTGLLVKKSGDYGTPLKVSTAQVSQDNLHATIVKSSGIKTSADYGLAYDEIPEGEDMTRTHYFQLYTSPKSNENLTYTITGEGTDFANWSITDRQNIGYVYK